MSDPITIGSLGIKIVDKIATYTASAVSKALHPSTYTRVEECLTQHLQWTQQWAQQIQVYGMPKSELTDSATVALGISAVPRRFQGAGSQQSLLTESDIICGANHYFILGDPGAGKTTTIKRLVIRILTTGFEGPGDQWQFPLVVRLQDLNRPLVQQLADILGVPYEERLVGGTNNKADRNRRGLMLSAIAPTLFVKERPLAVCIVELMNSLKPVVLLDGLDEAASEYREQLEDEIEALSLVATDYKMVVTCRSGDFVRQIDGSKIVEVCPLTPPEIARIAAHWLGKPDEFLSRVAALPFADLTNRPLFLTQLLIFFSRSGYLPERPSEVYSKILQLMLEDWDGHRRIRRKSKYASFNPARKSEFLSNISYEITYRVKQKSFTTHTLIQAYKRCCRAFNLPEGEAEEVASEIETHTGIVYQGRDGQFEFSHLSIQEYLCASHICRAPLSEKVATYFAEYPAPLAIAVAISSDSGLMLATIVLSKAMYRRATDTKHNLSSFLARLIIERPYFHRSLYLGFSGLRIMALAKGASEIDYAEQLLGTEDAAISIAHALTFYGMTSKTAEEGVHVLTRFRNFNDDLGYRLSPPDRPSISEGLLRKLVKLEYVDVVPVRGGLDFTRGPLLPELPEECT